MSRHEADCDSQTYFSAGVSSEDQCPKKEGRDFIGSISERLKSSPQHCADHVQKTDLNDYITPSQARIKPVETTNVPLAERRMEEPLRYCDSDQNSVGSEI